MSIGRWRRSGQAAGADRINVAVCHCASKPIPCHAISVLSIEQVWEAQRRAEAAAKAAAAPRLPGKESVSERVRADLADVLARLGFVRAPGRDGRGPGYVSTAYLRSTGNSWHQLSVSVGEDGDTQRAFSVEGIPYFVRRHDDLRRPSIASSIRIRSPARCSTSATRAARTTSSRPISPTVRGSRRYARSSGTTRKSRRISWKGCVSTCTRASRGCARIRAASARARRARCSRRDTE